MKVLTLLKKDMKENYPIYLIVLPVIIYVAIFCYGPMYGLIIAFKDFNPRLGIMGSPWVGLKHFVNFLNSPNFMRVLKNTVLLSVYEILWSFPAPIILALFINEIRHERFKKSVQTLTYLPHFVSIVVICGLIKSFTASEGLINQIIVFFGGEKASLLSKPEYFRTIYISSGIWQSIGFNSIIYLAAMAGINPELYEASFIDGSTKIKNIFYITLPSITPTIIILLILRIGKIMAVGHEKVLLLYNPVIYETADIISTYVYRKGLLEFSYSYSTAIGLFNSIINFLLLIGTNRLSKKLSQTSLW